MFERYFLFLVDMWYGLLDLCTEVFNFMTFGFEFAGESFYVFDVLFAGGIGFVLVTRLIIWLANQIIPG